IGFIADTLNAESQRFKGAPTEMVIDQGNKRIIITDTLEHIRKLETWVELLDIRPETRVYPISNVGFTGDSFGDVESAIRDLLTPDAYMQFDYQNYILIVRDLPEVHEDIEEVLSQMDQPPAQIMVQAEILETSADHQFTFGIDYDLSGDLDKAVKDGLFPDIPTGTDPGQDDKFNFHDLRDTFPIFSGGSTGVSIDHLSRHARIQFSAFMSDSTTKLLATPQIYLKNHEEAHIEVGSEVPYLTSNFYGTTV
ncbi:unnamed protein product, partial [marine sediment metagenome]